VFTICFTKEEEEKEKENHYLNCKLCLFYSNRRKREPLLASSTIYFIKEQKQKQEENC
jgi:hypothetical protein